MRTIQHPLSGALYDLDDDGNIVVTLDGKSGMFTKEGVWLSGEIRTADPHLCGWIGGKEMPTRHRQAAESYKEVSTAGGPHDDHREPAHAGPLDRDLVPGAARHRQPRRARRAALAVATSTSAPGLPRHALHQPGVPRAREGEALEQGVADGLPRGGHPRGRRHRRLRDLRQVDPRRALGPRRDQGVLQRLPAPRPPAAGGHGLDQRAALPVPRLLLEPRRHR